MSPQLLVSKDPFVHAERFDGKVELIVGISNHPGIVSGVSRRNKFLRLT